MFKAPEISNGSDPIHSNIPQYSNIRWEIAACTDIIHHNCVIIQQHQTFVLTVRFCLSTSSVKRCPCWQTKTASCTDGVLITKARPLLQRALVAWLPVANALFVNNSCTRSSNGWSSVPSSRQTGHDSLKGGSHLAIFKQLRPWNIRKSKRWRYASYFSLETRCSDRLSF